MKKLNNLFTLTALAPFVFAAAAQAATLEIEWSDPDSFRDIETANGVGQKRFQEQIMEELGSHFEAQAKLLPEGQNLDVKISNVDLAGYVEYFTQRFNNRGVRIVRDPYFPELTFTYELSDDKGTVIKSGEETISDKNSQFFGSVIGKDSDPLLHEKRTIDAWFQSTFAASAS